MQQKHMQLASMRIWVQSLTLLSGSGIQHCCELWWRSQKWLRSHVAVAHSCSSDSTSSLGNSICHRCNPKKKKKKKTTKKNPTKTKQKQKKREEKEVTGQVYKLYVWSSLLPHSDNSKRKSEPHKFLTTKKLIK